MSNLKSSLGSKIIDGHAYPADPSSEAFTDLLMDSFQRGRSAAAAKQREAFKASLHEHKTAQQTKPREAASFKTRPTVKPKSKIVLKYA